VNDLVTRLISYLEREKVVKRELAEGVEVSRPEEQIETLFVGGVFFLEKFSRIIENAIIEGPLQGGKFFVNLETFANLQHRMDRYEAIDRLDIEGYVYGKDDPGDWPLAKLKPVRFAPDDNLRRAWFMIFRNEEVNYSLVALGRRTDGDDDRHHIEFRGFWTTRLSVTLSLVDYLQRVVNAQYL
jgi:hypothetical protein